MGYLKRMLAFARFALAATAQALRGLAPDVVYATSPPLTMALPALAAALRHRAPLRPRCATSGPRRRSRWARCDNPCCSGWRARSSASSTAAARV